MIKTEKYVIDDISTVLILELENDVAYIWLGSRIHIMNITNLDSDLAAFIHLKYDTLMWNIYKQSAQGPGQAGWQQTCLPVKTGRNVNQLSS